MRAAIRVAAVVLALGAGAAALPSAVAAPVNCKDPGTTYEMNVCAGRDFKKADDALNTIYKQLAGAYDAANRTLLQAAQRSWLKFRDDECGYETNLTVGGTIHSTMVTNCDTELTLERVKRLKAQLACEEGDLGCNKP